MVKKFKILLAVVLVLVLAAPAAYAKLAQVGPINPNNGYPQWYMDTNGATAWLPTPPFGDGTGVTPPTFIFFPPNLANPFSVQIGFDQEAFYYICRADAKSFVSPLGKVLFQVGLEAAFANVPTSATNGQQAVFSRLRVTFPKAPAGTYSLKHPYGTETFVVTAADVTAGRGIRFTRDVPLGIPLDFTTCLTGDVGPFLKQQSPAPIIPIGTPAPYNTQWQTDPAGKGWMGDGVTAATITGSPIGFNQVRLDGPAGSAIGGPGIDFIQTNLFTVSGWNNPAAAAATPLKVDRVTYTRPLTGSTLVDAFATSVVGASVRLFVPSTATASFKMAGGTGSLGGLYFFSAGSVGVPATVKVVAQAVGATGTTIIQAPVDLVTITTASYSRSTKNLTISANSSDLLLKPPLTVTAPALGLIPAAGTLTIGCAVPPAAVTVSSSKGGSCTELVKIVP